MYLSDGTQRNTTETKELCQVFEKLLPYKYYSFNVTAKTNVGELRENEIQLYSIAQNTSVQITVLCVFCFVCNSVQESLEHFN
jgi:hypothetical protein